MEKQPSEEFAGNFSLESDFSPSADGDKRDSEYASHDEKTQKRQRKDPEGFVTPATPDIPCTSIHHKYNSPDEDFVSFETENPVNQEKEEVNIEDGEGDKAPTKPISDIMQDIRAQSEMILSRFSKSFNESEHFEMTRPDRLASLLIEAKALEQSLMRQKTQLVERLQLLSSTLQAS